MPVCSALAAAHAAGVVHRDIKPSNVFLHQTPQGEVPKILDFGIAKMSSEAAIGQSLTVDGSLLGTPAYMAPERFRRGPYGPKSDIYSVGAMLYEMLTGRLPFIPSSADPLALVAMQAEEEPPPLRRAVPGGLPRPRGAREGGAQPKPRRRGRARSVARAAARARRGRPLHAPRRGPGRSQLAQKTPTADQARATCAASASPKRSRPARTVAARAS